MNVSVLPKAAETLGKIHTNTVKRGLWDPRVLNVMGSEYMGYTCAGQTMKNCTLPFCYLNPFL